MGIKVHKILGYGLSDVQTEDYNIKDSRINPEGILNASFGNKRWTWDNYITWLNCQVDQELVFDSHILKHKALGEITWQSHHDAEYGLPNVLIITPPGHSDWSRYDDSIDYVEETFLTNPPQRPRVEVLRYGIFPYTGSYIDKRNGRILNHDLTITLRRLESGKLDAASTLEELAKRLNFKSYSEAHENIVPRPPRGLTGFLEWGEAFTSPEVNWQLRPMLYTYWS